MQLFIYFPSSSRSQLTKGQRITKMKERIKLRFGKKTLNSVYFAVFFPAFHLIRGWVFFVRAAGVFVSFS